MYDTIVIKERKCPICHKYVDLGFQTKAFERRLNAWTEGDIISNKLITIGGPESYEPIEMFKDVNAVLTMTTCQCPKCRSFLYADFLIRHSQILACLRIRDEEEHWTNALVDYATYFINWEPPIEKKHRYKIGKDGKANKIK